ncbi:MAG: tRNA (adenosine(37)-N6)-threonylcarbamoyltransferase complex dimerization subunit type 1 TsaB [Planctomycetota bacterium]|nr:tRNA (adenosine(37)-N6)-threonylcarbamoyltransferase complex dimerization subunit type 1 TsaB [Planctomycetota bacterium]
MDSPVSISIETSCRCGGVALGAGDELIECVGFEAARRHAVQLVAQLDELLARHGLAATDLEEVYVSAGPGSFTGLRIGVTVAAILSQSIAEMGCVSVPTVEAVAENAAQAGIDGHIGVIMDAKDSIYAAIFTVCSGQIVPEGPPGTTSVQQFLSDAPSPITLLGEGLGYHRISGEGIIIADDRLWFPTAEGVWRVGRRLSRKGQFVQANPIRPLYLRRPAAEFSAKASHFSR